MKAQIWTAVDDPYNATFQASDHEQELAIQTADFREDFMSYTERRIPDFKGE